VGSGWCSSDGLAGLNGTVKDLGFRFLKTRENETRGLRLEPQADAGRKAPEPEIPDHDVQVVIVLIVLQGPEISKVPSETNPVGDSAHHAAADVEREVVGRDVVEQIFRVADALPHEAQAGDAVWPDGTVRRGEHEAARKRRHVAIADQCEVGLLAEEIGAVAEVEFKARDAAHEGEAGSHIELGGGRVIAERRAGERRQVDLCARVSYGPSDQ